MQKKIIISFFTVLFLLFTISFYQIKSYSKYVIENTFTIATISLDSSPPQFELLNISNTNKNYEKYANLAHLITVQIKLIEPNIKINNFNQNTIKIKVGNQYINPTFQEFKLLSENSSEKIYEISFTNLSGNGSLELYIPDGIVQDACNLYNSAISFDLNIIIDNTPPTLTLQEDLQENSTSLITINSSEGIRSLESWNISNDKSKLSKIFYGSVSYPLTITDFAQNNSNINIIVNKASNLSLLYASYDSYSGICDASNGTIPNKNTITSKATNKIESIFIRFENSFNLELQGRIFFYTYWGEGSKVVCDYSEAFANYGYNPSSTSWIRINYDNRLYHNKELFTQFGAFGVNRPTQYSSNGKPPISNEIASQNLYGISGINFKLNNSSNFSVIYQTYIKDYGWQKVCSDGEESMLNYDKPISAFRINIVSKSDKQYLINYWNNDVGTSNIF